MPAKALSNTPEDIVCLGDLIIDFDGIGDSSCSNSDSDSSTPDDDCSEAGDLRGVGGGGCLRDDPGVLKSTFLRFFVDEATTGAVSVPGRSSISPSFARR